MLKKYHTWAIIFFIVSMSFLFGGVLIFFANISIGDLGQMYDVIHAFKVSVRCIFISMALIIVAAIFYKLDRLG